MSDLQTALRIHLSINKLGVWLMWAILGGILVINMALFAIFTPEHPSSNSALIALPCYFVVVASIAAARALPLALTLGLTRVRFYLASLLWAVLVGVVWAVAAAALARLEIATDGWGVHLEFFRPWGAAAGSALETFAIVLVALLVAFVTGWCFGIVHSRWGVTGLLLALGLVLVVIVAVIVLAAAPHVLPELSRTLSELTVTGAVILSAVLAVLLAVLGYFLTRRTAV
ncbi:MAG: hypothetical protein ABI382_04710 [Nakamurella sp.]